MLKNKMNDKICVVRENKEIKNKENFLKRRRNNAI